MARRTLTREAVVAAAMALADSEGLAALTMRRLGTELGVEAMSLYNHIANKDDLHRALVDEVWRQVDLARDELAWRAALHRLAGSAATAMRAHPWFFQLPASYGGPARMGVIDATLAHLEHGAVAPELAFHALHVLDGFIYGYAWQDIGFVNMDSLLESADEVLASLDPIQLPHLLGHAHQHLHATPEGDGFTVGLELLLDGLTRATMAP